MSVLLNSLARRFQPTHVALAGPCPQKALGQGQPGNPDALAERHVR
jgi:hypothetical protein